MFQVYLVSSEYCMSIIANAIITGLHNLITVSLLAAVNSYFPYLNELRLSSLRVNTILHIC